MSLKYDFNDLKSHDWIDEHIYNRYENNVPRIVLPDSETKQFLHKLIQLARWFHTIKSNPKHADIVHRQIKQYFDEIVTLEGVCRHLNLMTLIIT